MLYNFMGRYYENGGGPDHKKFEPVVRFIEGLGDDFEQIIYLNKY